jgi:YD repeat-containing protein
MTNNARGHITQVDVQHDGQWREIAHYEYDKRDALIRHTDALGHSTTFRYDRAARLTCMKNRLGYAIYYAYDDAGRCIRTWGQDGLYDERFEYYPEVRQSVRRSATGAEWLFHYDGSGAAVEVVDPYGDSRRFVLDDLGRVVLDIDETGQETELLYDPRGAHYARLTPLGDLQPPRHVDLHPPERPLLKLPRTPLQWRWGGLVRPDRIVARRARSTDSGPSAAPREIRDRMERVVTRIDQRGRTEQWKHDANGNVVEHVDADGRAYRTEIASWNLARRRIDPNGAAVQYDYNLHEYITKIVDPGGAVSEYVYDLKDRLPKSAGTARFGKPTPGTAPET